MSKLTPFVMMALCGLAAADPKDKPAAPPKAEAPRPPAEIDTLAKSLVGTWKCTGTTTTPAGSSEKLTAKVTTKVDLDKWWVNDVVEGKLAQGPLKMISYSTFDAGSKKWRRVSIDNMGNQYVGTSDGLKDGKLVWNLDFMGAMGAGQFKDTVDTTDAKAGVKFTGVMSVDKGKSWKPVYDMVCKK